MELGNGILNGLAVPKLFLTVIDNELPPFWLLFCLQQLQVNGLDVVINGHKARRAMVYGVNGVLEPVKRNCDEIKIASRYVSQSDSVTYILFKQKDFDL